MVGRAAIERVVAALAPQDVVAGPAVDQVIAGAAFGAVVAAEQVKLVVAGVTDEEVRAVGARAGVGAQVVHVPVRAIGKLHAGDAADLARADGREEAQQAQGATIGCAQHQVRPGAQQGDLGGAQGSVDQHPVQAGDVAGHAGIDSVKAAVIAEAVGVRAGIGAAHQQVVAGAAIERVAATLAVQRVVAAAALHAVVATGRVDDVVATERVDVVAVGAAVQDVAAFARVEQQTAYLGVAEHLVAEDKTVHLARVLVIDQKRTRHAQAVAGGGDRHEQVGGVARKAHLRAAQPVEHRAVDLADAGIIGIDGVGAKAGGKVIAVVARTTVERVVA